ANGDGGFPRQGCRSGPLGARGVGVSPAGRGAVGQLNRYDGTCVGRDRGEQGYKELRRLGRLMEGSYSIVLLLSQSFRTVNPGEKGFSDDDSKKKNANSTYQDRDIHLPGPRRAPDQDETGFEGWLLAVVV
ncbi:hypothetical protein CTA1_13101, partial [Colletotrichum tanaceti]